MEIEVNERIKNNPKLRMGQGSGENYQRRHGYQMEVAKYIREKAYESHLTMNDNSSQITTHTDEDNSITDLVEFEFDDDLDGLFEYIANAEEHIWSEQEQYKDSNNKSSISLQQSTTHSEEIPSDATSLLYMSIVHEIFHELVLNRNEQINRQNSESYIEFAKSIMVHFGVWRQAQLKRKMLGDVDWERQSIDRITWRNLRFGVAPFLYFARYVLHELQNEICIEYIPMLLSNQSALESHFSSTRGSNHDKASNYSSHVTTKSTKQASAALAKCKSYTSEDIVQMKDTALIGSQLMRRYSDDSNSKLNTWLKLFETETVDNYQDDNMCKIFESTIMNNVAEIMNTHIPKRGFIQILIREESFQQWFLLSIESSERMQWFSELSTVDSKQFDSSCRSILFTLFSMMERAIWKDTNNSFEVLFRNYLIKEKDFCELYEQSFPTMGLTSSRHCALYLVESIKTIFDRCVYKTIIESTKTTSQQLDIDTTSPLFLTDVQKMVGGGIRAAKLKFLPDKAMQSHRSQQSQMLTKLFELSHFKHDVKQQIATDYKKYYPSRIKYSNMGGLYLIEQQFIPWAITLLKFIIQGYHREGKQDHKNIIANHLMDLRKDTTIINQFKQILKETSDVTFDLTLVEKIHLRIAEFTFRAYTKRNHNDKYNPIKTMASDKTNLAFRTEVQTGCHSHRIKVENQIGSDQTNQTFNHIADVTKEFGQDNKSKKHKTQEQR